MSPVAGPPAELARHLALPAPAAPLFELPGPGFGPPPDLLLAAYGEGADGALGQLHVTDLVAEAGLATAWAALEAAYHYSSATFALCQRVAILTPTGRHLARSPAAPSLAAFDRTLPYYTTAATRADGDLLILALAAEGPGGHPIEGRRAAASGPSLRAAPAADPAALRRMLRAARPDVLVAVRRVGSVFWHCHM